MEYFEGWKELQVVPLELKLRGKCLDLPIMDMSDLLDIFEKF